MKIVKVVYAVAISEADFAHATKLALKEVVSRPRKIDSICVKGIDSGRNSFGILTFKVEVKISYCVNGLHD